MNEDCELLRKRFLELSRKSESAGIYCFSDFLGLSELATFGEIKTKLTCKYTLFGGTSGTERVMVRFGDENEIGYGCDFPITCLRVAPKNAKFADKLTHRDFLGSILNLGIERSMLGDIAILDNVGYVFAKDTIAKYIAEELSRIKHTDVTVSIADTLPEGELFKTELRRIQANGERVDALIAKVFNLSRDDSSALFKRKLVFVDGRQIESSSYCPKEGETVSVRGYGRFIYRGYDSLSRKGKKNITVELYI